MRGNYSQVIPAACLGLIIGACSSSNGALPDQSADAGTAGNAGNESSALPAGQSDGGNTGGAEGTQIATQTSGDTAGMVTDGVGTTGGGTDIVGASAIPAMQGEWSTGCLEMGSMFSQQTLSVVGARMLTELSVFSDQSCTVPELLGAVINGSTVQRFATTVPTGTTVSIPQFGDAIEVNLYFEEGTVDNKPLTAEVFPGRDNYLEKIEYNIVLVENDVLYFGDNSINGYAGESAESRPVSLNTLVIYSRQL